MTIDPVEHALRINEILASILNFVSDDYDAETWATDEYAVRSVYCPIQGAPTLAALARTCRLFHTLAIDVLWHFQSSLTPLIKCLPSDAITVEKNNRLMRWDVVHIIRDLHDEDYARLLHYGKHIRVLGIQSRERRECMPNNEAIPMLCSRPLGFQLLPQVRYFIAPLCSFNAEAFYPSMVMGPNIRSVKVYYEDPYQLPYGWFAWEKLVTLMSSAASLATFTIDVTGYDFYPMFLGSPPELMRLYRSFRDLEILDTLCIEVTHEVFSSLATLPKLRILDLHMRSLELACFLSRTPKPTDFSSLVDLHVDLTELPEFCELLRCPGFQRLQALRIFRSRENMVWDLDPLFKALGQMRSTPTQMQMLHIVRTDDSPSYLRPPATTITKTTLTPLLAFAHLTELILDLDGSYDLDDKFLKSMALAWPAMRTLHLQDRTMHTVPETTLYGLTSLTAACPKLKSIMLRVNALDLPTFQQLEDIIPSQNVCRLDVCTSPIRDPNQVATILALAFPGLEEISAGWVFQMQGGEPDTLDLTPTEAAYQGDWRQVYTFLRRLFDSFARSDNCLDSGRRSSLGVYM
ncbi:hypothetical protein Hypma_001754 [Hypsizygus marmoreus]|uniref:F-box domain-containing protein n=1 Tax=Hypsizygus marmoreus TaxID=39966 RepID=A0A369J8B1_HYPMA|nr:hypothetical protein Hypma_001754 [Hypsizygus marmoreus]